MKIRHFLSAFFAAAAGSIAIVAEAVVILPDGYTKLDYVTIPITSAMPKDAVVLTNVLWKDVRSIRVVYSTTNATASSGHMLFSAATSLTAASSSTPWFALSGTKASGSTLTLTSGGCSGTLVKTPGDVYNRDGTVHELTINISAGSASTNSNYYFQFGGGWSDVAWNGTTEWYELKITNEVGTVVAHLYPCKRVSDGVIGFYDIEGDGDAAFHTKFLSSWADFIAGPASGIPSGTIDVLGSPANYGTVSPAYGNAALDPSGTTTFSVSNTVFSDGNTAVELGTGHRIFLEKCEIYRDNERILSTATNLFNLTNPTIYESLTATWSFTNEEWRTTASGGEHGTVAFGSAAAAATAEAWTTSGETVTLTTTPAAGWKFSEWTGDIAGIDVFSACITFQATAARNFTATWIVSEAHDPTTFVWTGGVNDDWNEPSNWDRDSGLPEDGDTVIITPDSAQTVNIKGVTAQLAKLIISNTASATTTLVMSNWLSKIKADDVVIGRGGVVTCAGPFTDAEMSNRVYVTCSTLCIESNGAINVDGKGWAGGAGGYGYGYGPGGGGKKSGLAANYFYGGSYGGSGRLGEGLTDGASLVGLPRFYFLATNTYGSAEAPLDPGSGGNGPNLTTSGYMGGSGGGAVRIIADQIVVNGLISANGTVPVGSSHGSGGSGGGIYITCSTITGTNGTLSANGAQGQASGGGAGGGRIAVAYEPVAQGALPVPSVRFSAAPGKSGGGNTTLSGDIGTLWFPDAYFFSPTNLFTGQWMAPAPSELALDGWTVSNVWVRLPGINLTVTNALTIAGTDNERYKLEFTNAATIQCGQLRLSGASLTLGGVTTERSPTYRNPFPADVAGPTLTCAGDLIMTNAARFHVYAGLTNAGAPPWCGVRVEVGNDLLIATNCWVYPVSHPTNGASPLFTMRNLTVGCGGGFNADCFGCAGGIGDSLAYGEGAPTEKSHGAGYGGTGGVGYRSGSPGLPYGSAAAPTAPGSGAKSPPSLNNYGPYGGGSVQIRAEKKVNFYGVITANGGKGQSNYGGGASGGGIYITCHSFIGNSNALLQANGGGGQNYGGTALYGGGGGSGGRIAVWRVRDFSASAVSNSVSGGLGGIPNNGLTNAAPGTFILDWLPADGTLMQFQ